MLGSFKGDKEIKQMEDEREGGREKKREGERGIGERERERKSLLLLTSRLCSTFCFLCPTLPLQLLSIVFPLLPSPKYNYLSFFVFLKREEYCSKTSEIKPEKSLPSCGLVDKFFLSPLLLTLDILLVIEEGG